MLAIFNAKLEIIERRIVSSGMFVINPWQKEDKENVGYQDRKTHVLMEKGPSASCEVAISYVSLPRE